MAKHSPIEMSSNAAPWRAWYKTARWQTARITRFVEDRFTCRRCGHCEESNKAKVELLRLAGMTVADIVAWMLGDGDVKTRLICDHNKAHRGSERLFWDATNHRAMCKPCHDRHKQAEEQASLHTRGIWY